MVVTKPSKIWKHRRHRSQNHERWNWTQRTVVVRVSYVAHKATHQAKRLTLTPLHYKIKISTWHQKRWINIIHIWNLDLSSTLTWSMAYNRQECVLHLPNWVASFKRIWCFMLCTKAQCWSRWWRSMMIFWFHVRWGWWICWWWPWW